MMEKSHSCACHTLFTLAMSAFALAGVWAVACAVKKQLPAWRAQMRSVGEDCKDCCEDIGKEVRDCAESIRNDLTTPSPDTACE